MHVFFLFYIITSQTIPIDIPINYYHYLGCKITENEYFCKWGIVMKYG
jgi:hypothetical protein